MKVLLDFCRFHKLLYFRMTMVQIAKTVQDSRGRVNKKTPHPQKSNGVDKDKLFSNRS
ncbi:TPA: hypothetical protein REF75_002032 [Staphylococcus pseudintermedius]|nr:hypothetical protein [Staphylococcus pseudintermedius]EGQ3346848.1 hypothetical protein [Staphylococcus pseudintermedius]EHD7825128.1 hypothetical protein [Staphylococcus pseudintermedius]HDT9062125.1 hypothetical protein [Staphylococcus pseudintermedius]